jgi:type I restriction enzyme, S subunit
VEQDPSDEPASELLKRIARKKAKHGKGRDWSKGESPTDGLSFEAPQGWAWTTIDQTALRVTVGHVGPMKDKYVDEGIPFLRSQNVRANAFRPDGLTFISPEFHQKIIKSALAPRDVVVVRSGNVGTACVVPPELPVANCSDLVVIQSPEAVAPEYLCFYLNSLASVHVEAGAVGVALTHFNTKSVATMPFPLPPLAEQHRIVAKVDALMALCDRLEAALTTADTTRARLLEALLHEALEPADTPLKEAAE